MASHSARNRHARANLTVCFEELEGLAAKRLIAVRESEELLVVPGVEVSVAQSSDAAFEARSGARLEAGDTGQIRSGRLCRKWLILGRPWQLLRR